MLSLLEYDRANALKYARQWAMSRNPKYYDFSSIGGDCTNFISQCVYAGSKAMNYNKTNGWYYNSASDRSPSWTGVNFFRNFILNNKGQGPFAEETDIKGIVPGDVIQLGTTDTNFYHSLFVLETNGMASGTFIATHTFDALMRPVSSYIYTTIRFFHIKGVRKYM